MRSAVILVGGEARRAGGREKFFFQINGETFIDRLIGTLEGVVDEIIVVAKDTSQCTLLSHINEIQLISDVRKGIGPIGGLHAGITAARGEEVFVVACDMPCVHTEVVLELFSRAKGYDAVIPAWEEGMIEPLHAVYRRMPVLDYLKNPHSLSLRDMINSINTRFLDVSELRQIDPLLQTFTNINDLQDLKAINGTERKTKPGRVN